VGHGPQGRFQLLGLHAYRNRLIRINPPIEKYRHAMGLRQTRQSIAEWPILPLEIYGLLNLPAKRTANFPVNRLLAAGAISGEYEPAKSGPRKRA
jgi:hypothetical protein